MSETTVFQYRVYCIEENTFVTLWSIEEPTICPNEHADRTIDPSQTVIIDNVATNTVITKEPTTGQFQHTTRTIVVPSGYPGDVSVHNYTWPMDLEIWKTELFATSENIGDEITLTVAPNTIVGQLTSTGNIGDTVLNVTSTAVTNDLIVRGVEVELDNTFYTEDLGRVVAYDATANTITVENAITMPFVAGSMVKLNLRMVKDAVLHRVERVHRIGEKGFKAKTLPANTIVEAKYKNNDGLAKSIVFVVEYYYI